MDVCAKLRGVFQERRVGHAGTLDPMATGVLPIFLGRATRAVEFASESEKEYEAGLQLGVITNTQDISGEVLETRPVSVTAAQVEDVLARFRGDILQVPPMYSAIKINGKKLYDGGLEPYLQVVPLDGEQYVPVLLVRLAVHAKFGHGVPQCVEHLLVAAPSQSLEHECRPPAL